MTISQENNLISVSTPLGKDIVELVRIEGQEWLSKQFRFELTMVSDKLDLDPMKIVGKPVSFGIKQPDDAVRYFHGMVDRWSSGDIETVDNSVRSYEAVVVPWTRFLELNSNCRVFQEKTIPQVIEQVFKDSGFTDYKTSLKGTYAKLDYCVQYNESDLNFVSRLMEEAGIFYYFNHEESKHTLVLADTASGYVDAEESSVAFYDEGGAVSWGTVNQWWHDYAITSGKVQLDAYDFEAPDTVVSCKEKTIVKTPGIANYELYRYVHSYAKAADGKPLAVARMEQEEARSSIGRGSSTCVTFLSGAKFKFSDHPDAQEQNQSYTLLSVNHHAKIQSVALTGEAGADADFYANEFQAIPAKTSYRPPRRTPKPRITGVQTAKVVGAKGQEVLTDKYGRIKVQFHWDREGKFDDKSSCWIRVAQAWAGPQMGAYYHPRVGDEVLVDFLDGDPDRPIIVGSLHNADNMPVNALPDGQLISGVKTKSSDKGKAKNYNELKFDDTIGKELVYFHAERDFQCEVENNDTLKVGFDAKDKGDQTIDIYNDRTVTIAKGKESLTVQTGDRVVSIDKGNDSLTVKQGDLQIAVKAGAINIEAAKSITLKVGPSSLKMDTQGITLQSAKITAKANLKVDVQGTLVDVNASGVLTLKGGLVKIN